MLWMARGGIRVSKTKLKDCPFCGSPAARGQEVTVAGLWLHNMVTCINGRCALGGSSLFFTARDWNKRAPGRLTDCDMK